MRRLNRTLVFVVMLVAGGSTRATAALVGPGSGTATVSPLTATVAVPGTWTFLYSPDDAFTNGTLRVTIPDGWTAPQNATPTAAGYLTVTDDYAGPDPAVSIAGQVISLAVTDLPKPKVITIVYGDTGGGSNPGAKATPPTVSNPAAVFVVESDPTGTSVLPIGASPSVNLHAGPIVDLEFMNSPYLFLATEEGGPYSVRARDSYNNPSPVAANRQIDLTSTSAAGRFSLLGGASFTPVTFVVMATGSHTVTFYYRDTIPGSPTLTASGNGQTWTTATQAQSVDAGPPEALELSPGTTTITAGNYLTLTIDVVDAYGNPTELLEGRSFLVASSSAAQGAGPAAPAADQLGQFYLPGDHSTPITALPMTAGQQTAQVDYMSTDANDGSAHRIIILSETPSSLSGTADVTVQPGPISASVSVVSAASPIVADGTPSAVTVTVKDQWGNPKSGVTVALGCTGSANHTNPAGPTGADGVATGIVTNTKAEGVTVSATANGTPLVDTAPVLFVPGPVSASVSVVDAVSPVPADNSTQSQITVTAKDAYGNPVSGSSVTLSVTPSSQGETLTQPPGVTDSNGHAFGYIRSSKTGARTIHAQIGATSVVDTAPVVFEPGDVDHFEWSFTGTATAGDYKDVTLRVYDSLNNLVADYADTVYISTTSSGAETWAMNGAAGSLGTYPNGQWYYKFNTSDGGVAPLRVGVTVKETITLSAERLSIQNTSALLVVDNGAATQIAIVPPGDGQTAQVAQPVPLDLVVRVRDAYNNLVDGESVTFDNVTGGGSVDVDGAGPLSNVATTASNGEARCDVWTLGQIVGTNTVRARIGTGANVVFSATGTPGSGEQIVWTTTSQSVTVGTDLVVGAILKDQFGNPVPGVLLTIVIKDTADGLLKSNPADPNPTTGTTTSRQGTTDSNGKVTVLYQAPATAGLSDTVDATGGNASYSEVPDLVFTSVAGGATKLLITELSPTTQNAGSTFSFKIQAVDGNNNLDPTNTSTVNLTPQVGSGLVFSLTDWGSLVPQVTLVGGQKAVYGRGYTTGTWSFTADDPGPLAPDSENIQITSATTIDHYDVTASTGSVTAGANFNVTVVARDAWGNRVTTAANSVSLDPVDPTTNNVVAPGLSVPSATLVSGQVVVAESYTKAPRSIKVRAQASGKLGYSGVIQVNSAAAHHIVAVTGDLSGIVAGATVQHTAEVQDNYDNPVPGETVSFSAPSGGGSVSPPSAPSGSDGRVTFDHTTGTTAGSNVARAQILDGSPTNLERVEWSVQTVAGSAIDHYVFTLGKTTWTAHELVSVQVRAYDINNNPVNDNTTTVQLTSTTGHAQYTAASGLLSGGLFSTTARDDVAETLRLIVSTNGAEPKDTSGVVTVTHAATYQVVKISGDAAGLPVETIVPLVVEVQDAYANPIAGEIVTFNILSSPAGATLTPGDGVVSTGSNGRATVNLNTSTTAGTHSVRARILDGSPSGLETKTFAVTTVAGAITHYQVLPTATEQRAGLALNFTVNALDASNNIVDDDVTIVALSLAKGSGTVFGQNPVTLSNGTFTTTVTSILAQTIQIRAQTQGNPAIFGLGPDITIRPNYASGTIVATAAPDTITADGKSKSTVTTTAIRDAYGNTVETGTLVTVSTNLGTITSTDVDPAPGIQHATNASGGITVEVQSGTGSGTAIVTMTAVSPGTAAGTKPVVFAPRPVFASPAGAPSPPVVTPGETVGFQVLVQNTSATAVTLTTGTTFSFTDGVDTYTANLVASTFVPGPGSKTLVFQNLAVPNGMDPIRYTPTLSLSGTDEYGASFTQTNILLPVNSLSVTAIEIYPPGIVPASSDVTRGHTQNITVWVKNKGPVAASIESVNFSFSMGNQYFNYQTNLSSPVNIPAGINAPVVVPVDVLSTAPVGPTTIDAAVAGTVGGTPVSDPLVDPYPQATWQVRSGAVISYVAGSLTPPVVSRGKAYSFKVQFKNDGDATVELRTPGTKLSFTDGTTPYQASLTQNETLGAGTTKQVAFTATQIPSAITADRDYNVALHLEGLENSVAFPPVDLSTGSVGDSLTVQLPANIVYAGSLTPLLVTKTTSAAFEIRVNNLGTAEVELTPGSTTFSFGSGPGAFSATLDPTFQTTISSDLTTLRFNPVVVNTAIGSFTPQIHLVGVENTLPFGPVDFSTSPNQVTVQEPANLTIESIKPWQRSITSNQQKDVTVTMRVTNSVATDVRFDSASLKFMLNGTTDRSTNFVVTNPTGFFTHGSTLPGNQTDSLRFTISSNTAASGFYVIEGNLCVTDIISEQQTCVNTSVGGKGSIAVQSPGVLDITGIVPSQPTVTTNQTQPWTVGMTVKNTGEADVQLLLDSDATLDSTFVGFSLGGGWVRELQTTGPITLGQNASTAVVFNITQTGNTAGTATINGTVRGIELNSDNLKIDQTPPGSGTVMIQTPANLQITQIVKSRGTDPVTEGQTTPWTIAVTVANTGGAEALLSALATDTYIDFAGATANGRVTGPTGTLALPGGQQTVLAFTVAPTPGFGGVPGEKTFNVRIQGRELNTNSTRVANSSGTVLVELKPDPQYVAKSIWPKAVEAGDQARFSVIIDEKAGTSTLNLDRLQTFIRFGTAPNVFQRQLDVDSVTTIGPGGTTKITFEAGIVPLSFPQGKHPVTVTLGGDENDNAFARSYVGADTVSIRPPTDAEIVRMTASRDRVSASQSRDWTLRMIVTNTGNGDIRVVTGTKLVLKVNGTDVTNQYTIGWNPVFQGSGTNVLSSGSTDSLLFNMLTTGSSVGNASIDGVFVGEDTESGESVSDDTYSGGWTTVLVQRPGALRVTNVQPSRSTVTVGQTTSWTSSASVQNTGEAAVNLTFDAVTPDVVFEPGSGFVWSRPSQLQGGGTLLSGGATGTLVFSVTQTGDEPATTAIHGVVAGVDTNSLDIKTADTRVQGSGSGSILVEDLGSAVITSATIVSPRTPAPDVNRLQTFGVRVTVANQGEADLEDVWCKITSSGGSAPPAGEPDTLMAPSIPGGTAFVGTFTIKADDVFGPETLTVSVLRGKDKNSQQMGLLITGLDRDVIIQKFDPSVLAIESVTPSQPTVTRSQTADWYVDVALWNSGGSDLDVRAPSPTDISFWLIDNPLIGYVVDAPDRFLNGAAKDFRMNPGEKDTLRYTVATTGGDVGQVTLRAREGWIDVNDAIPRETSEDGAVTVVSPSGFFINTTQTDPATTPHYYHYDSIVDSNHVYINSSQTFVVRVNVQNQGSVEDLVDVRVKLASDYATSPLNLTSAPVDIPKNSEHTFVFAVTLAPLVVQTSRDEILTATITSAKSKNTGLNVTPNPPADNQQIVTVQKAANLSVTAQASDNTLSTGQLFTVTGAVSNLGIGEVDGTGEFTLRLPPDFELVSPDSTVGFGSSGLPDHFDWDVRAPGAAVSDQEIRVKITKRPNDLNIAEPTAVRDSVATVVVAVATQGGFQSPAIAIIVPAGAMDDTVSTRQTFTVRASAIAEATTIDVQATLVIVDDPGFVVIDPLVKDLPDGTGAEVSATWRITVPASAGTAVLRVDFNGNDRNTHDPVAGARTPDLPVTIVERASLVLGAEIARPPEAIDGSVAIGSRFEIDAVVWNVGGATIDPAKARLKIDFSLATDYSLYEGTEERSFTIGEPVTWVVSAPPSATPLSYMQITMSGVPADENTGLDAEVADKVIRVAAKTDNVYITADNLSEQLGLGGKPVPKGTSDIDMLAIELANTGDVANPVRVDSIAVSVLTGTGGLASSPSATLGEFYAVVNGYRVDGDLGANPVLFNFTTIPGGVVLDPAGVDSVVFTVSVLDDAALDEIVVSVENADDLVIRMWDKVKLETGKTVPVVDKTTLGSITGRLRSQPLVILGAGFEEYVHNYPNPFRAGSEVTRIAYTMENAGSVKVTVFDVTGELVYEKQYANGEPGTSEGPQEVTWDGHNMMGEVVRNGIYICQLDAGGRSVKIRIAVAK